jgi:hypothetical protein
MDCRAEAPWPRAMGALAPEFTGAAALGMATVKGARYEWPMACHAPSLSYGFALAQARFAFRCAYDVPAGKEGMG